MFDWLSRRKASPEKQAAENSVSPTRGRLSERDLGRAAGAGAKAGQASRALMPSTPPGPAAAYAQQWPLVGADGSVRGFELALMGRAAGLETGAAATAHQTVLMAQARLVQASGRTALVSLPAAAWSHPAVLEHVHAGMHLVIRGMGMSPQSAQALREQGAKLGLERYAPGAANTKGGAPFAPAMLAGVPMDFVVIRAHERTALAELMGMVAHERLLHPNAQVMATGVADVHAVEQMLRSGIVLVGGRLAAGGKAQVATKPTPASTPPVKSLEPLAANLCTMINQLAQDQDAGLVAQTARRDVALSVRLLRYVNSPAVGLRRKVDSIEQALALIGRNEFRRWLQVMLLSSGSQRPSSQALQEDALARGRLFEGLAKASGEPLAQALFTLGLLSKLDLLMQMPLAQALAPLRLPDDTMSALLHRKGQWAAYLAVADALELDEAGQLEQVAAPFGGAQAVITQAQKAWAWAAQASEGHRAARDGAAEKNQADAVALA